jgi:MFS family permease
MYNNGSHVRIYRDAMGGIIAGIFVICLAVAIFLWGFSADWFLPVLFLGLGLASLIGCFTAPNRKAAYGSIYGVVWFLGLSLCFWIGFWPWILLPVGFSIILGALATPILGALRNGSYPRANQQYPPTYQHYQPYQPYQPGQPLPPQQPYWSPQQSEQGNLELQQEPGFQQEVEQQHQHV